MKQKESASGQGGPSNTAQRSSGGDYSGGAPSGPRDHEERNRQHAAAAARARDGVGRTNESRSEAGGPYQANEDMQPSSGNTSGPQKGQRPIGQHAPSEAGSNKADSDDRQTKPSKAEGDRIPAPNTSEDDGRGHKGHPEEEPAPLELGQKREKRSTM